MIETKKSTKRKVLDDYDYLPRAMGEGLIEVSE